VSGVLQKTVTADEADMRLDRWFKQHFPTLNHGRLEKLLRTGQIRVDGGRVKANARLVAGQMVRVPPLGDDTDMAAPSIRRPKEVSEHDKKELKQMILFQDDWVIVLNKPPGLAVQGGTKTDRHLDGLLDALAEGGERPRLTHRLDKDTSGVLVLARTVMAARRLTEAFRERDSRKDYWAITIGVPLPMQGDIKAALTKGVGRGGERMMVTDDEEGKSAVTSYAVIDNAARVAAWVGLRPITGRTHQLRVHLAEIGTPILGDDKYTVAPPKWHDIDGPENPESFMRADMPLHLHARRILLPHPNRGSLKAVAPAPVHFTRSLKDLGLSAERPDDVFDDMP
jgi:23S rRNA pseudouridine955/2504/2580 synthase